MNTESVPIAVAAAKSVVDNASRLGLTWNLMPATVKEISSTAGKFSVVLDGDTVSISADSMLHDPLFVDQRVYVIVIPPSGVFIVGYCGGSPVSPPNGQYMMSGGFPASSTGVEVAVPSLSWTVEPTYTFLPGRLYRITAQLAPNFSLATAQWAAFRVREGSASIVGTVVGKFYVQGPAGFSGSGASNSQIMYAKAASTVSTKLSLTVQLLAGGGAARIYGGEAAGPTFISVEEIGSIAASPNLAGMAALL